MSADHDPFSHLFGPADAATDRATDRPTGPATNHATSHATTDATTDGANSGNAADFGATAGEARDTGVATQPDAPVAAPSRAAARARRLAREAAESTIPPAGGVTHGSGPFDGALRWDALVPPVNPLGESPADVGGDPLAASRIDDFFASPANRLDHDDVGTAFGFDQIVPADDTYSWSAGPLNDWPGSQPTLQEEPTEAHATESRSLFAASDWTSTTDAEWDNGLLPERVATSTSTHHDLERWEAPDPGATQSPVDTSRWPIPGPEPLRLTPNGADNLDGQLNVLLADAYRIAYRLTGDPLQAEAIATESTRAAAAGDRGSYRRVVTSEAVARSLAGHPAAIDDHAQHRARLRRELARHSARDRCILAMRHLSHVPAPTVAAALGLEEEDTRAITATWLTSDAGNGGDSLLRGIDNWITGDDHDEEADLRASEAPLGHLDDGDAPRFAMRTVTELGHGGDVPTGDRAQSQQRGSSLGTLRRRN